MCLQLNLLWVEEAIFIEKHVLCQNSPFIMIMHYPLLLGPLITLLLKVSNIMPDFCTAYVRDDGIQVVLVLQRALGGVSIELVQTCVPFWNLVHSNFIQVDGFRYRYLVLQLLYL